MTREIIVPKIGEEIEIDYNGKWKPAIVKQILKRGDNDYWIYVEGDRGKLTLPASWYREEDGWRWSQKVPKE